MLVVEVEGSKIEGNSVLWHAVIQPECETSGLWMTYTFPTLGGATIQATN